MTSDVPAAMRSLPVFSYGPYDVPAALPLASAAKDAAPPPQCPAASSPAPVAQAPSQPRKQPAAPRQPAKKLTPLEMRTKAVFRALEKLLEKGVESETQLWAVARILSGDEYAQVAEERYLAGQCGNPLCSAPSPAEPQRGGGRYKIDLVQQVVYDTSDEPPPFFCSPPCEAAVRDFCRRLGSHAAAQHRFDVLMRHAREQHAPAALAPSGPQGASQEGAAQQPAPQMAASSELPEARSASGVLPTPFAGAGPAPSRSSSEGDLCGAGPRGSDSAALAQSRSCSEGDLCGAGPRAAALHRSASSSSTASSSSSGGGVQHDEGGIRWAPGEVPQQWTAHNSRPAKPAASARSPATAAGGAKGVLKKSAPQFAAGTAKTPIMLAEVKERDPLMVAADTARSLPAGAAAAAAPLSCRTAASGASRTGPRAVEGYVPRAGKSQFKQVAAQQAQQEEGMEGGAAADEGGRRTSPQRRVRFSDEDGGSLEMPSAAELAAAASGGVISPAGSSGLDGPPPARTTAGAGPRAAPRRRVEEWVKPSSPPLHPLATAARLPPPAAPAEAATPSGAAAGAPAQGTALAAAAASDVPANGVATTATAAASTSASPAVARAPVLVFDIEDPAGPLEAASGTPNDDGSGLATHFGRLRVVEGDAQAASPATAAPAAAPAPGGGPTQPPLHPLHQQHAVQKGQPPQLGVEAELGRQMQASMRRLFPRLSATLPAELDASLEADLASDSEGDAESAGWSSSSEDEAGPGALGSSDDDEAAAAGGSGRPRSAYRTALSFFGTLFTHLESWATHATLDYLAAPPSANAGVNAGGAAGLPPPSAHSAQIEAALARFLAAALPPVAQAMAIAVPRSELERYLNDLLHTMRFAAPLPGFKATQWQLVVLILLKALSVEAAPALRPAFETREGIQRLGKALAALAFTYEEFVAVLEVLLPEER